MFISLKFKIVILQTINRPIQYYKRKFIGLNQSLVIIEAFRLNLWL